MIIYTATVRVTVPTPAGGLTVNLRSTNTHYFKKLEERMDFVAACREMGVEILKMDIEVITTAASAITAVAEDKVALVRAFSGLAA